MSDTEDLKKCPYCAELIKAEAVFCRYCHKELIESPPVETQINESYQPSSIGEEKEGTSTSSINSFLIIILILLGLFWVGLGLLQIGVGVSERGAENLVWTGIWNFLIAIAHLWIIKNVNLRRREAFKDMIFVSIIGSLWGIFQLLAGVWLHIFTTPLYVVLGVLALVNKGHFTELTPRELEKKNQKQKLAHSNSKVIKFLNWLLAFLGIIILGLIYLNYFSS